MSDQGALFPPKSDLELAREEFFEAAKGDGSVCRCCRRYGKYTALRMHSGMARALIWLYHRRPEFVHVPKTGNRVVLTSNSIGKFKHYGFVEAKINDRDPSKKSLGYYRITDAGIAFVEERIDAPARGWVYDDQLLWWEPGDRITIREALKKKFNYEELMAERPK